MKRDAKNLLEKSISSLLLSIELFNRPHDIGRTHSVIMLLDHSFEMLLKAGLIQKGCNIIDKKTGHFFGMSKCIHWALIKGSVDIITEEEALGIQAINANRDYMQHSFIDLSENQLYFYVQSGFTIYQDVLKRAFNKELFEYLPKRVLPVSTIPPISLDILYQLEVDEIKKLLKSSVRKKGIATSKLRSLELLEKAIQGDETLVTENELSKKLELISQNTNIEVIFPNVTSIAVVPDTSSNTISFRFTKKEGIPIHIVPEGTPGSHPVGIKKVNELGFYNMSRDQLADAIHQTKKKTDALIWYLNLKQDENSAKHIIIGKTPFVKYSFKAISKIKEALTNIDIDDIWKAYRENQITTNQT